MNTKIKCICPVDDGFHHEQCPMNTKLDIAAIESSHMKQAAELNLHPYDVPDALRETHNRCNALLAEVKRLTEQVEALEAEQTGTVITEDEIRQKFIEIIMAEYRYWRNVDDPNCGVEAVGALANVIAALNGHKPTHHKPPENDDE